MHYYPVVDQISLPTPLDPLTGMFFVALFVASALLTMRRASYGLALLLFIAPFALYRNILDTTITLPKVVLVGVIVGLLTYERAFALLRERRAALVALTLLAVLAATMLSYIPATHHGPVVREAFKAFEHLLFFAVAYVAYRIDANDRLFLYAFAASVLVVIVSALAQEATGAPSGFILGHTIVPRIAGVLEGPNQLAGYLEIAVGVLGAWAIARPCRWINALLGAACFTVVLTYSRAGVLGVLLALAVLALVTRRAWWRAGIPSFVGGLIGALLAAAWGFVAHSFGFARFYDASNYAGGVGNRNELWHAAWVLWRAHPWLGVGAGNYELDLPQAGLFGVRTHANSWYLQALVEGGIPLLAATLAFVAASIATLGARVRAASPWTLGAFAATIALCVHQIVDYLIFYQKVGGPWMLAIGLGLAAVVSKEPSKES